jgi:very-short-patch-repair endonuclease
VPTLSRICANSVRVRPGALVGGHIRGCMAEPTPDAHVISDKPNALSELCQNEHVDSDDTRESRVGGSICQFEQVRGQGDREIARLAACQHGHVHRQQIYLADIKRGGIAHRLKQGRLYVTLPSVYRVSPAPPGHLGRAMAAALRFRGSAVVACRDAAEIWNFVDTTRRGLSGQPVDVLLVATSFHVLPGIHVRRVATLPRQDIRWRHGIPVTSPARTLLDLAAVFDDFELEAALATAFRRGAVRPNQIADVINRNSHAKGARTLGALAEAAAKPHDTRSDYERRLLALIRKAELPLPRTNAYVGQHMVDMLWPDLKFVVEFDSWSFHGHRSSFEQDRLRDQVLSTLDHQVMRVTARHVDRTPTALVARLAAIMTARRLSR